MKQTPVIGSEESGLSTGRGLRLVPLVGVLTIVLGIVGCGGSGGTTTVVKEARPTTVEKTTTVEVPTHKAHHVSHQTPASESKPAIEPASAEPPNVVGLSLPAAEEALKEAGFKAAPRNTDTAFGIVVPSHYTICKEGAPRGKYVPVLAQKYGC